MYTFGIFALIGFLISGLIFRKEIKQNQFAVGVIVVLVTLIGTGIVNGIYGLRIEPKEVVVKTKECKEFTSHIILPDTTYTLGTTCIDFEYEMEKDSTISDCDINLVGAFRDPIYQKGKDRLRISFLPNGSKKIPYFEIIRNKRVPENNWVSSFGLPRTGERIYHVYLPNDSVHVALVNHINEKFYEIEQKDEIAFTSESVLAEGN